MDFEDINPIAVLFGIIGGAMTLFMMRGVFGFGGVDIGLMWKILTPIVTFAVCFLLTQKMFE